MILVEPISNEFGLSLLDSFIVWGKRFLKREKKRKEKKRKEQNRTEKKTPNILSKHTIQYCIEQNEFQCEM